MPTVTLKNIPDELYARLKAAAKAHHRSLNSELLHCAEQVLAPRKIDVAEHLAAARALRAWTAGHQLTDADLAAAKHEGRP